MATKLDPYSSHGQKVISLFARLMVSYESHSLTELSRWLRCSKQTVLRLIDIIQKSYGADIEELTEGNRKFYKMKKMKPPPTLSLTRNELNALNMCRAFTECLLGRDLFQEATRALEKSQGMVTEQKGLSFHHLGTIRPGSIDYTPHQDAIRTLIDAMDENRICKISYRSILSKHAKTFFIKPLKIFSYYDTVYVDARLARLPDKPYKEPEFDPLLAVHRIKNIEMTDRMFQRPKDYDFEKVFNRSFGIVKEGSFQVEVELSGYSAEWASERIWSPDQTVKRLKGGKIKLSFTASSDWDLMAWLLPFEDEARLLKPDWLVEKVKATIGRMQGAYA